MRRWIFLFIIIPDVIGFAHRPGRLSTGRCHILFYLSHSMESGTEKFIIIYATNLAMVNYVPRLYSNIFETMYLIHTENILNIIHSMHSVRNWIQEKRVYKIK